MKKRIVVLFLFINIFLFGKLYQEQLFLPGQKIEGVIKGVESYFFIEPNWVLEKNPRLKLKLIASQLTLEERSTLTISVNGKPIKSYYFPEDSNGEKNLETIIDIPREFLKKGANEISLKKMQRLTKDCNLDEINPANWIRIDESLLTLIYENNNSNIDLGMFPIPFVNKYPTNLKRKIRIGVPKDINDDEKIALANMALNLGSLNKKNETKIEIYDLDELEKDKRDYIVVANYERLPKKLKSIFSEKEKKGLEKGRVLKLIKNPMNPERNILIYTGTEKFLGKGPLNIFIEENLKFLKGNYFIIPNLYLKEEEKDEKINLNSLGIGSLSFANIGKNSSFFVYEMPKGKIIDSLSLNLKYLASELVNLNDSTLGVSINGEKIGDTIIRDNKPYGELKVQIPPNQLVKSKLYIEVFANLISKRDCSTPTEPWLTVLGESEFKGDYREKTEYGLDDFPVPFVKNGSFNKLGVSVASDKDSLEFFAEIFKYMGKDLKKSGELYYLKNPKELLNVENAIVIGSPLNNNIISEKDQSMFIQYSPNKKKFELGKQVGFLNDNIYSAIQLVQKSNKNILYIFTDEDSYYDNILKILKNREVKGDAYLSIGLDKGEEYFIETEKVKNFGNDIYFGRVKMGFVILAVVIVVFIALGIYFKKK